MRCEKVRVLYDEYVNGKLKDKELDRINAHLEQCSECKEIFKSNDHLTVLLRAVPKLKPQGNIRDNVFAMIEREKEQKSSGFTLSLKKIAFAASFAAIALFLILVSPIYFRNEVKNIDKYKEAAQQISSTLPSKEEHEYATQSYAVQSRKSNISAYESQKNQIFYLPDRGEYYISSSEDDDSAYNINEKILLQIVLNEDKVTLYENKTNSDEQAIHLEFLSTNNIIRDNYRSGQILVKDQFVYSARNLATYAYGNIFVNDTFLNNSTVELMNLDNTNISVNSEPYQPISNNLIGGMILISQEYSDIDDNNKNLFVPQYYDMGLNNAPETKVIVCVIGDGDLSNSPNMHTANTMGITTASSSHYPKVEEIIHCDDGVSNLLNTLIISAEGAAGCNGLLTSYNCFASAKSTTICTDNVCCRQKLLSSEQIFLSCEEIDDLKKQMDLFGINTVNITDEYYLLLIEKYGFIFTTPCTCKIKK